MFGVVRMSKLTGDVCLVDGLIDLIDSSWSYTNSVVAEVTKYQPVEDAIVTTVDEVQRSGDSTWIYIRTIVSGLPSVGEDGRERRSCKMRPLLLS